jgi:hypothetical protein
VLIIYYLGFRAGSSEFKRILGLFIISANDVSNFKGTKVSRVMCISEKRGSLGS